MRLAMASPNTFAYSDTFISIQMERLPRVLKILGAPAATETPPGGMVKSMGLFRCIPDTAPRVLLRRNYLEGDSICRVGTPIKKNARRLSFGKFRTSRHDFSAEAYIGNSGKYWNAFP